MTVRDAVPYNNDAEIYLLGSIFLDNKIISGLVGKFTGEEFYNEQNRNIFKAMLNLFNDEKEIEILSVLEQLKRNKVPVDEHSKLYLIDIVDSVPSTAVVSLYITEIEEKALERQFLATMTDLSQDILKSRLDFNDLVDKTEEKILNVIKNRRTTEFLSIEKASNMVYEQIQKYTSRNNRLTGLDTGYRGLNDATLGFQKGDLMILAARPSVGKSALAINLAVNVSKLNNANVAFFSLEMSIEQLMFRLFSYESVTELSKIRSGNLSDDELVLLGLAKQNLSKLNIYFDENSGSKLADIRSKCRHLKNEGKLDFIIIDYLQLVSLDSRDDKYRGGGRQEEVAKISRGLKVLARELNVPILALSQLSRSIESREDKQPNLSDLRESGSIEQDADLVMFLFKRSDVEEKEQIDQLNDIAKAGQPRKEKPENEIKEVILSIAKNRQGPLNYFDFHFYGHTCRFTEQKITKEITPKRKRGKNKLIKETGV